MSKNFKINVEDKDFRVSGWCGNRPKCVAVAIKPEEGVAVRDTKSGETIYFDTEEWGAFVQGVKDGEFDVS